MPARDIALLTTEERNPRTRRLDALPPRRLVELLLRENEAVPRAVRTAGAEIARAVLLAADRLSRGGRMWIVGAGTSGRLAALEAAECPPTFSTPPALVRAVVAGGRRALTRSVEGAEDDADAGARAMRRVRGTDVVVGVAASGRTPFVAGALEAARRAGAARILVACAGPSIPADVAVVVRVGPEVIAGSTRLKAGTATKLVLNALSVAVMTRLGKVHDNLMVDVRPTNAKLRDRAVRIVCEIGGCDARAALGALQRCGWEAKTAAAMVARGLDAGSARRLLRRHGGFLRPVLEGR